MSEILQNHWPDVPEDCPLYRDYRRKSRVLLVSFSGLRAKVDAAPDFSFRRVLRGLPIKVLYLRDLERAWYLRGLRGISTDVEGTLAFLRAEAESIEARRVILTGFSLGGFAALLYGSLMGADEVHAFSPQTFLSIRRRVLARDGRWRQFITQLHFGPTERFPPLRRLQMFLACRLGWGFGPARRFHELRPWLAKAGGKTKLNVHFASDSDLDAIHAKEVADLPGVISHDHQQGGHELVRALMESGKLRTILEHAIAGTRAHVG